MDQAMTEIRALRQEISRLRAMEKRFQQTEMTLKSMEERYQLLGECAPLGIFTMDSQGSISGITRKTLKMFSRSATNGFHLMNSTEFQKLLASDLSEDIKRCIHQNIPVTSEHPYSASQGEPIHLRYHFSPIPGNDGTVSGVMALVEDHTDLKRTEEALRASERRFRDQALQDELTGLYNRRYLFQSLEKLIEKAKISGDPVSLIFMDLDHFKQVVDTHGHLNGSRTIRKVARTIDACLEEPDYAVAYAGDEFVLVLPGTDQGQALERANQIRSQVKETAYELESGIEIRMTASFGIATFPQHAMDLNGLISAADQALFTVKKNGKDAIGRFQGDTLSEYPSQEHRL